MFCHHLLIACFYVYKKCLRFQRLSSGDVRGCTRTCPQGQVLSASKCECVKVSVNPSYGCPQVRCVAGPFPCKEYRKDSRGCNTCECGRRCFRSRCPRTCRGGTESYVDNHGCTACRCKQQPVCGNVRCALHCSSGYVKDTHGCDTCQCKQPLCDSPCKLYCPHGREVGINGCQLCKCK